MLLESFAKIRAISGKEIVPQISQMLLESFAKIRAICGKEIIPQISQMIADVS
jgi:hypothetical protein